MAKSGTISKDYSGWTYKIEWSASQSTTDNTSTITCTHKLVCKSSYSLYIGSRSNSCTVDGTKKTFTSSSISTGGGTTIKLGTTKHTVSHKSDGTKSCKISGTFNIKATLSGVYKESITASETVTLNTIPRASTLSVANGTLGTSQTLTVTRQSTSFKHRITATPKGGSKVYINADGSTSSSVVAHTDCSIPFTPPLSWASCNTSGRSIEVEWGIGTYKSDDSRVGGNTYPSIQYTIPSSTGPAAPTVNISDGNGYASQYQGYYIQNKSKLNITASATGQYGATIKSYAITLNGSAFTSGSLLTSAGTKTISVTATDTRDYPSNPTTKTIEVLPYSKPTINLTISKSKDDTDPKNPKYIATLSYNLTYATLKNQNEVEVIMYTDTDFPNIANEYTIASKIKNESGSYSGEFKLEVDPDTTYTNVYLTVKDALGESGDSAKSTIWGSERIFYVHKTGQGISLGKKFNTNIATSDKPPNLFECKWDALFDGKISNVSGVLHSSDRRVKKNIETLNTDIIDSLQPVQYELIGFDDGKSHYGFIAQDVIQALLNAGIDPKSVGIVDTIPNDEFEQYALAYTEFIPLLVNKCQNLQSEVTQLHQEIAEIKKLIT